MSGVLAPSSLVAHGNWLPCHRSGILKSKAFSFSISIHILYWRNWISLPHSIAGSLLMQSFCYAPLRMYTEIFILGQKWHFWALGGCLKVCTVGCPLGRVEVKIIWNRECDCLGSHRLLPVVFEMSLYGMWTQTPPIRQRTLVSS